MIFNNLEMRHRAEYEKRLSESGIVLCQYSFLALWAWRHSEKTEIFFDEDYPICWLKNRNGLLSPICKIDVDWDWKKILASKFQGRVILNDVPENLTEILSKIDGVKIEDSRSEWEYIYSVEDLIGLKGNKFHHKRTHIKKFERYKSEYQPLISEDFEELKKFQAAWLARQEKSETLEEENCAIIEMLECWDNFPVFGATIRIDGKIAAFTIAEELSSEVVDIRFEKAFSEYEGIYQALNKNFLARQGKGYKWVNREEDMGNEGLRQAKSSYNPTRFEKKFKIIYGGTQNEHSVAN